jgi:hypothetical protein
MQVTKIKSPEDLPAFFKIGVRQKTLNSQFIILCQYQEVIMILANHAIAQIRKDIEDTKRNLLMIQNNINSLMARIERQENILDKIEERKN